METKKFKNQEERKKILERIKKIMAVAKGSSFEGEADTAMKMAQSYMKQYGLSMSDVEFQEELKEKIIHDIMTGKENPRAIQRWTQILAGVCGMIFDCQFVLVKDDPKDRLSYIGYSNDVEMAKLLFGILYNSIRTHSRKLYPMKMSIFNKAKDSFRLGCCIRLLERAHEEKQKDQKENNRYGLMVVEKGLRVKNWSDENLNITNSKVRNGRILPSEYEKGRKHADSLDLMNKPKVEKQLSVLQLGHQ